MTSRKRSSMTSSTSCSSSKALAVAIVALAAAACAGARDAARAPGAAEERPEGGPGAYRVALFPAENLAAVPVPLRGIDGQIARALAAAGLEVVTGDLVERFLERHRLRYTGGLDSASAAAAHEELGVDGVLLVSIEAYDQD